MKIETADIYHLVIKLIAKKKNLTIEEATEIVDESETWLIDAVEAFDQTSIPYLATCIFDFHCDKVNN